MRLADYIKGERHGQGAHDIELDAMRDPFLSDAIDGFDAVPGDHSPALDRLAEDIRQSAGTGRVAARARASHLRERRVRSWSIAAAVVFIAATTGGGVFLLKDGIKSDSGGNLAHEEGYGKGNRSGIREEVAILPPVTVVPNETASETALAATADISVVEFDELEIRDFSDNLTPAPDTTTTARFRRFVMESSKLTGSVTVSFEVDAAGRPQNIIIVESSSPEAVAEIRRLLEQAPDWSVEPSRKRITIEF